MQLIIDIVNTLIKYYVFDEKTIINSSSENHLNWAISLEKNLRFSIRKKKRLNLLGLEGFMR